MAEQDVMSSSAYERHLQSLVAGVGLLLLGWIASGVHDNGEAITKMQRQIAVLETKVEATGIDRYHASEADAAHQLLQIQIDSLNEYHKQ